MTRLISHSIEKIVYPYGDVTDPITGRKVVAVKYRDQIEEEDQIYGKSPNAFDYSKAPPRGRLEGKQDFSHNTTYIKYHDNGEEQPFGI